MQQSFEAKKRVLWLGSEMEGGDPPLALSERYDLQQIAGLQACNRFLDLQSSPSPAPSALLVKLGADPELPELLERLKAAFPAVPVITIPETEPNRGADFEGLIGMIDQAIESVSELGLYSPAQSFRAEIVFPPAVEAPLEICTLTNSEFGAWDAFVMSHPEATFFHRAGWKRVLEEVYGHKTYYLFAKQGNTVVGVLPLGHIQSRMFGNSLISTPFCVYGGVLASDSRVKDALQREACDLADRLSVDHLELRHIKAVNETWPRKDLHVTFRKAIHADPEVNMKEIPRKQRRMVRQGIEYGLCSEIDESVERFYGAYAESVRNLGTPVHSKRYFSFLKEIFGDDCEILSITHQGKVHSSVMSFFFRNEVSPYYGGGGILARQSHANDFMYWELMRRSAERGIQMFDFGRSKKGVGSYSFKKHWGFHEEPLHYEFHLVRSENIPDVNPLNPKYALFIAAWKKLPLSVSTLVGPFLAKDLG